jgi:hypothetical protein
LLDQRFPPKKGETMASLEELALSILGQVRQRLQEAVAVNATDLKMKLQHQDMPSGRTTITITYSPGQGQQQSAN